MSSFYKHEQTNNKRNIQISSTTKFSNKSVDGSSQNIFIPKFSFKKKESNSFYPQTNSKTNNQNIIHPFAFSHSERKKISQSGDTTPKSKLLKHHFTERPNFISQNFELINLREENDTLKREYQRLKSHYQNLLGQIQDHKTVSSKLHQAYQKKCEQTQTLKSIVNSIKRYIFQQDHIVEYPLCPTSISNNTNHNKLQQCNTSESSPWSSPFSQKHQYWYQNQNKQNPQTILKNPYRRKVSITESNPISLKTEGSEKQSSQRMISTMQKYARMKLVQSIKGSTYDIYSQNLL